MTVPCQTNPNAFLQPGEDNLWHHRTETRFAQAQCRNACERFQECAAQALAIGTCEGQKRERVADGCIMAGIVCRGDADTYRALHEIVYPGTTPEPYADKGGEACIDCDRMFIPAEQRVMLGENTAHMATEAHTLCRGCYSRRRRGGLLAPVVTVLPTHCVGPCGRRLRRRADPVDVGSARHEAGGFCVACVRANRRAESEAA